MPQSPAAINLLLNADWNRLTITDSHNYKKKSFKDSIITQKNQMEEK